MQVFPSYFLCVTLLCVVKLCTQNAVTAQNSDTTLNPGSSTTANDTISTDNVNITTSAPITTTENLTTAWPSTTATSENGTTPITTASDNTTTTTNVTTTTSPTTTTIEPCSPLYSFNVSINQIGKTAVNFTIAGLSDDLVCATQVLVNCTAPELNNTIHSWTVQSRGFSFQINDTNDHIEEIWGLSEFTNYTCDVIINDNSTSTQFFFQTKQEVPSVPRNLTINNITSTSFTLTWEEPEKIPSILVGYEVTITRKHVASVGHFWNNCSDKSMTATTLQEISFFFDEALPDFIYDVTVVAISSVGYSDAANKTTNTSAAASVPPENVTAHLNEKDNDNNIFMTQNIIWDMPCDTYGPVTYFIVKLSGSYVQDQSPTDIRNATVDLSQNQTTYSYSFQDIRAASNYTFQIYLVGNMTGQYYVGNFSTDDNYPSAPEFNPPDVSSHSLNVTWIEPGNYPGKLQNYTFSIEWIDFLWTPSQYCNVTEFSETKLIQNTEYSTNQIVPYANYNISVFGSTLRGDGNVTEQTITSDMTYPDQLSISGHRITSDSNELKYNASVTINFERGCINGMFHSYIVNFIGTREGYDDHSGTATLTDELVAAYSFNLRPEHTYMTSFTVNNTQYTSTSNTLNFTAPAGVPTINSSFFSNIPIRTETTQTVLTLKQLYFDKSQGSLRYVAIIISSENITGGSFNKWEDNSQWPIPVGNSSIYYQATPKFWDPFLDNATIDYTIGENTTCYTDQYCNKPLQPNTKYFIFLRLFNNDYYINTMPVSFVTEKTSRLVVILAVTGVLVFIAVNGFVVFVLWRKGYIHLRRRSQTETTLFTGTDILKRNFISYCQNLEQNPSVLEAQWNDLETQSQIIYNELPHHFATSLENRRKNRYTNILPFDHSRVKLNIDEDDEICSDYINASFIKGFSGEKEYIASQGPLFKTCRDFWKMILQEKVSIIVMVSRFIENNRDKCYKYFPNNRETMTMIGDDIEVRCSMELHFGFYCIRTLQVKKELKQVTVTHMQFLEWPDFGVPNGTESMLSFCHQFKERWAHEGGMALVHCSAGVGRTGTIIATDILVRAMNAGNRIDVFNTVLELRRQRQTMVQTKQQYLYIHQLIKSMIEFPILDEADNGDHVYENVDIQSNNRIVESPL